MPKVKVHSITVFFANHSSQEFDPDYIASLWVKDRELTVTAEPTPSILELMGRLDSRVPVSEVEFCYRAGNQHDYCTRVLAGVHPKPVSQLEPHPRAPVSRDPGTGVPGGTRGPGVRTPSPASPAKRGQGGGGKFSPMGSAKRRWEGV